MMRDRSIVIDHDQSAAMDAVVHQTVLEKVAVVLYGLIGSYCADETNDTTSPSDSRYKKPAEPFIWQAQEKPLSHVEGRDRPNPDRAHVASRKDRYVRERLQ